MSAATAPKETGSTDLQIRGIPGFTVEDVYAEGHTLTSVEASVLNQTRRENLRNNFAKKVEDVQDKAKAENREVSKAEIKALQEEFATYAAQYTIEGRSTRITDPVRAIAVDKAKELILSSLKDKGIKRADVSYQELKERAEDLVDKNPKLMAWAKDVHEKGEALIKSLKS